MKNETAGSAPLERQVRPQCDDVADAVSKALRRAYSLGQTYWQQADSESYSQNKKADDTERRFAALVEETRAQVLALDREAAAEDLHNRLHSLSKAMESSGRIDEHEYPDAYGTILDAMNYVQVGLGA